MDATVFCKRCKDKNATVQSRKEPFCNDCFVKFVSLKQRKRMMGDEYYRDCFKVIYDKDAPNGGVSEVALPFDFGTSCIAALDVLTLVLKDQISQHRGKTGFKVHVITVYMDDEQRKTYTDKWNELCAFDRFDAELMKHFTFHLLDINAFLNTSELQQIVLDHVDYTAKGIQYNITEAENVKSLLSSCPNRSTKEDLIKMIIKHVVKKFTYQHPDTKVILWGHSMTKLADEIIGLVIKGRGSQVARALDAESFDEDYADNFKNLYALKDIFLSETDAYCIITGLESFTVNYKAKDTLLLAKSEKFDDSKSVMKLPKNMTIDELVRKYFTDIEMEYSNIIATVLRTGDKLKAPEIREDCKKCSICNSIIYIEPSQWLSDIAVLKGHPVETEEEQLAYNEWKNSKVGIEMNEYFELKDLAWENGSNSSLCYGCIINLNSIKKKNLVWLKHGKKELNEVLNEYQLNSDSDD
ncbi:hypothetical protein KAFR_0J02080 [Kazachstania africana CBS 2517]|uniref:Cytoplasmic tRNA 2-thiolation protein 2 n=1 Tax=Kazachstania africana (strain ATCC 22294 / BCRC 22015 / CBS 2517 / CECT 1963 / NBRC 1671 / NRRL Y-8276) TaxID=1071382 RepID=H2B0X2_KAZAF|nr:hypothetical protein KAFR_0J02080 [Kazachstania africana CBS 2517]CCF60272.1 hypothetical protein KAFR_0J02080 [Kazachstania africana CBS 2517]